MSIEGKEAFEEFLEENQFPKFTIPSLGGTEEDLCAEGGSTYLRYDNRERFVDLVKKFRLSEFTCSNRMQHVKAGTG